MNYDEMSDSFIAQEIARHEGIALCPRAQITSTSVTGVKKADGTMFDPCNNPADMWPLIVENEIAILPYLRNSLWIASGNGYRYHHIKPLRAAAIVYLMMMEAGK